MGKERGEDLWSHLLNVDIISTQDSPETGPIKREIDEVTRHKGPLALTDRKLMPGSREGLG